MPNYRYNAPEYARRNNSGRPVSTPGQSCGCQVNNLNKKPSCCEDRAAGDELSDMPLAMAYVPWQQWRRLYEVEKGFHSGTIFEELNKPFKGIGGCCR